MAPLLVTCPALGADKRIPLRHANRHVHGGENISPPVSWSEPPPLTRSILVTIIDLHPMARQWIHWCVSGIPPDVRELNEGASLHPHLLPTGVTETNNSFGEPGYGGPAPPPGSGPHEYEITVYALNGITSFKRSQMSWKEIDRLIGGMVIASGKCVGLYERK